MPDNPETRRINPIRVVRLTVLLVLTGVFLYSGYKVANLYFTGKNEEKAFTELAKLVEARKNRETSEDELPDAADSHGAEKNVTEDTPPSVLPYYEIVYEKNPDFTGWLTLPNTNINYPVMYTPHDPEHYLRTAFDGTYATGGTPFIGANCDTESDCFIIYGHNMKNKSMFGTLDYYAKAEFRERNPEIFFDTLYEERTYRVFAAFEGKIVGAGETGFRYYNYTGELDETAFSELIAKLEEISLYKTGERPSYGDQILLLSTCARYDTADGRFVVAAYRSIRE